MLPLLTVIISFLGALVVGLIPDKHLRATRWIALITASAGLATAITATLQYVLPQGGFQSVLAQAWIPSIGIQFKTGVDGISLTLLLLTGLIAVCGVLFSWDIDHRTNTFFAFFLALIGGVYGVFLSLDLVLLFVFYEIAIVPKYFLIAIWGSTRREYAAMKLVLYSFTSSALVLFGLIALYFGSDLHTFDITQLMTPNTYSETFQIVVFPVVFLGFAVLAGMWPFHTWAPTGHVAAPTAASMLLAGVVMKLGAYGCLRIAIGLLPIGATHWAPVIAWIAVINILYGALIALVQNDFKFVIGYSSVSHMGFVLLGLATLNATGLNGAVLQMFSHGVIGALLFAIVGGSIYRRTHTRQLAEFDRLIDRMPAIAWIFIVAGLASMGLPGFTGFIAELNVLVGAWQAQNSLHVGVLIVAGLGIIATFAYTLVKIHEAFFRRSPAADNPEHPAPSHYPRLTCPEIIALTLLIATTLGVGLFPGRLITLINTGLAPILIALSTGHVLP
jgi:NADH-quinone oxidoreductase subunit M